PDGVIISSPNKFHFSQAMCCIDAGVTVLIEKPITDDVNEGIELVNKVEKTGAKVLIGHHRSHSLILAKACEVIKSGKLGRLVSVIGSAQFRKPEHYFLDGPWRAKLGGGPILINMIHEISNLRSLMGEIRQVQAIDSSNVRNFEVEDSVAINFVFKSGALGTFMLSDVAATAKSWEQTSRENPSFPNYYDEDCYTISGTMGSLSIPTMRLKFYPREVEPSWWNPFNEEKIEVMMEDPLLRQIQHLVRVIRGDENPLVSAKDGLRNLKVTQAIKKSISTGRIIDLEG
ncbi:MAG: gfo/Idh/MocA family oxidoreductase, partial [Gammaproteobacteria bacterium]|nr:gfo/Idh/MocA family oxidoreductase [Gammaproteobacteria bacterium]